MKGSEIGIASMVASLVLAAGTAYQWISRVDAVHGSEGEGAHARGALGGSPAACAAVPQRAASPTSSR